MYKLLSLISFCIIMCVICCDDKDAEILKDDAHDRIDKDSLSQDTITAAGLHEYLVFPQTTDSSISESSEYHYAYRDTRVGGRNKLLVFLGGTYSYPKDYQMFCKVAASLGYHVVNINYINSQPVTKCGSSEDLQCFKQYHEEVLLGNPVASFVEVDSINSIYNRTTRLIQYLVNNYPQEGWQQFIENNVLVSESIVVAGHSQGGDHATYWAYRFPVSRLIVFGAPNNYSLVYERPAPWYDSDPATAVTSFYGLIHKQDEIVTPGFQYAIWKQMGLLSKSDTVSMETPPYNGAQGLVTNIQPQRNDDSQLRHNLMIRDDALPEGKDGELVVATWKYFLDF